MATVQNTEDRFNRADGSLGSSWTVPVGALAVVNQSAKQTSVVSLTSTARHADTLSVADSEAEAFVSFSSASGSPYAAVFMREDTGGNHRYFFQIVPQSATTADLRIVKRVAGSDTILAQLAAATFVTIALNKFFRLRGRVQDRDGKVNLAIFFDFASAPVLSVTDQAPPTLSSIGNMGFEVFEGTGAGSPTVTVDGYFTAGFERVLPALVARGVPKAKWTFAKLAQRSIEMIDRGSVQNYNLDFAKDAINFTEQELVDEYPWWWTEGEAALQTRTNTADYDLAEDTNFVTQVVDTLGNFTLRGYDQRILAIAVPSPGNAGVGQPQVWTTWSRSPHGTPLIRFYPPPDGRTLTIRYYRRGGLMEADDDLPMTPQQWVEVLLWGAIRRGSERDTDPRFYQQAQAQYMKLVMGMRAQHRRLRTSGRRLAFRSAVSVGRWRRRSMLPVPRIGVFDEAPGL